MDVTSMTNEQLKAIAYDILVQAESLQKDLNAINAELAKRVITETNDEKKSK